MFTHKELVTALIKAQGIHDGIWGLHVRFGLKALNVGASDSDLQPAAVVPLLGIGLQRFEAINNVSVNAAEANPKLAQKLVGAGRTKAARKKR
jgi:hypothetical protein